MKLLLCSLGLGLVFIVVSVAAERQHAPAPAAQAAFERANGLAKQQEQQADATVAAFVKAIEADPEFTAAHEGLKTFKYALIERADGNPGLDPLVKRITDTIQGKYRELEKQYPNSAGVAWGIVMQFYWVEDPRARPYLLKIVKLQPDNARVWFKLSADAEFRGDSKAALEYRARRQRWNRRTPITLSPCR